MKNGGGHIIPTKCSVDLSSLPQVSVLGPFKTDDTTASMGPGRDLLTCVPNEPKLTNSPSQKLPGCTSSLFVHMFPRTTAGAWDTNP